MKKVGLNLGLSIVKPVGQAAFSSLVNEPDQTCPQDGFLSGRASVYLIVTRMSHSPMSRPPSAFGCVYLAHVPLTYLIPGLE